MKLVKLLLVRKVKFSEEDLQTLKCCRGDEDPQILIVMEAFMVGGSPRYSARCTPRTFADMPA